MQKIEATILPFDIQPLREELERLEIHKFTYAEIKQHHPYTEVYRGSEYKVQFMPKIKVEVVVHNESEKDKVIGAIQKIAGNRRSEKGLIYISEVLEETKIKTGERRTAIAPEKVKDTGVAHQAK